MKRRMLGALAAASLIAALPATPATASPSSTDAPIAQAACKRATIGGQSRCIARGQFCARRYQRDYRRYGYSCSKRDRNGRWHLQ